MGVIRKTIRKVGSSKGIIFNSEESKNYNIQINDIVDIEIKKVDKNSLQIEDNKQ